MHKLYPAGISRDAHNLVEVASTRSGCEYKFGILAAYISLLMECCASPYNSIETSLQFYLLLPTPCFCIHYPISSTLLCRQSNHLTPPFPVSHLLDHVLEHPSSNIGSLHRKAEGRLTLNTSSDLAQSYSFRYRPCSLQQCRPDACHTREHGLTLQHMITVGVLHLLLVRVWNSEDLVVEEAHGERHIFGSAAHASGGDEA